MLKLCKAKAIPFLMVILNFQYAIDHLFSFLKLFNHNDKLKNVSKMQHF